ncbi:hypothetical protein M3J09_009639 [Ascochyta lentis]
MLPLVVMSFFHSNNAIKRSYYQLKSLRNRLLRYPEAIEIDPSHQFQRHRLHLVRKERIVSTAMKWATFRDVKNRNMKPQAQIHAKPTISSWR